MINISMIYKYLVACITIIPQRCILRVHFSERVMLLTPTCSTTILRATCGHYEFFMSLRLSIASIIRCVIAIAYSVTL